jgi:hypothetical protein
MITNHAAPAPRALAIIVLFAVVGWVFAAGAGIGAYRAASRTAQLESQAQAWRQKAGRAYTAYLRAEGGGAGVIRLPEGATWSCKHTPHGAVCDTSVIYPPANY